MMKAANPFSKFLMDKYKSNEEEREKKEWKKDENSKLTTPLEKGEEKAS